MVIDTSTQQKFYRHRNGIKFTKPDQTRTTSIRDTSFCVEDILNFPFNVYLLNTDSVHLMMNEANAETI